jgi:hypothetical protein
MRIAIGIVAVTFVSCAECPQRIVGPGTARIEDSSLGLPIPVVQSSIDLLVPTAVRRCQVLFEPAFSSPYAVWFVQDNEAADATVVVRVHTHDRIESYSALLDRGTAVRLSRLCLASLTLATTSCSRIGMDGVWYHAAHPKTAQSYAMASFWSPQPGTLPNAFVKVAEALRNYATLPEALRSPAWIALQEAADSLSVQLGNAG